MRTPLILAVVVSLFALVTPAVQAQSSADEAAVRQAMEQFVAAYNSHDAKVMLALYADDYKTWTGTPIDRAAWEKGFSERQKDHLEVEDIGIVFVTPDVAIYKCRDEYTNRLDEDGKPLPPAKSLVAVVYVKRNGQWLRAAVFSRDE